MAIEKSIHSWITGTLSACQPFLGGLPPCPYATEAILRRQVKISESLAAESYAKVKKSLEEFSLSALRVHVIAVQDWQHLSPSEVSQFVKKCREEFYSKDLWLLYDHPDSREVVQDFSFNHGTLLLFMVQKLSDLVQTSMELQKTDYYKEWPREYFHEVVRVRENYYERYLNQLPSPARAAHE